MSITKFSVETVNNPNRSPNPIPNPNENLIPNPNIISIPNHLTYRHQPNPPTLTNIRDPNPLPKPINKPKMIF